MFLSQRELGRGYKKEVMTGNYYWHFMKILLFRIDSLAIQLNWAVFSLSSSSSSSPSSMTGCCLFIQSYSELSTP